MNIPPHFLDHKNKEIVWHLPDPYPAIMGAPTWVKSLKLPSDYSSSVVRSEEGFYKLRAKADEL